MARRRVTYLEVADERPGEAAASGSTLDLDAWAHPGGVHRTVRPARRSWPACPAWLAVAALAALLAGGGLLAHVTTGPDERAAIRRARDRREVVPVVARPGPVVVPTASIVAEPWTGVFEHHPDARGAAPVPRVHALALAGPGGRALLVVDATRRAFGGPEHPVARARDPRRLGAAPGPALATLQWDAGGYGLSLTTVGLSPAAQRAVAGAVRLPEGASLQHGRPPLLEEAVLQEVGLAVTEVRDGPASAFGSPLIGQAGGASIEGQLHQRGRAALLVSVVQDQLASAALLRRALGPTVAVDPTGLPGIVDAAALDHGPAPVPERRIRGWARLVLDHAGGVTIELSSDVLDASALLAAAQAMDLGGLVRTTVPPGGAEG